MNSNMGDIVQHNLHEASFPDELEWAYGVFMFLKSKKKREISARKRDHQWPSFFSLASYKGGRGSTAVGDSTETSKGFRHVQQTHSLLPSPLPPHFLKTCGSTAVDLISAFHNCLQHIGFPCPHHQLRHKKAEVKERPTSSRFIKQKLPVTPL
jgi:hypothetical protein